MKDMCEVLVIIAFQSMNKQRKSHQVKYRNDQDDQQLPHFHVQGAQPKLLCALHTCLTEQGFVSGSHLQQLLIQVCNTFPSYDW